jgi:putative heme transporter
VATIVAVVVLARRLQGADLGPRLRAAEPGWVVLTVGLSILPVVGSTVAVVALTPGRLPFWRTVAVQIATSFVNVVTPASAGGLALNMRYLHRRRVPGAAAVAVVGIVQTTSILVTAVLVLGLVLVSGSLERFGGRIPWPALAVAAVVAVLAAAVLRVWKQARAWLSRIVLVPVAEAWPPLRATLTNPRRVAAAVAGHLTVTLGFAGTLGAAVHAFGGSASLLRLTLVVVGSSAVSGAVPVPGGIGAAEATLLTGLVTVVHADASTALSAVLLYRLVTFWARVPVGWIALLLLRRNGDV